MGSEMCIRDRCKSLHCSLNAVNRESPFLFTSDDILKLALKRFCASIIEEFRGLLVRDSFCKQECETLIKIRCILSHVVTMNRDGVSGASGVS